MSQIKVKMIKDSVSKYACRISTLQLRYHRYIHSEVMTHRVFSRSASSSRAIPIKKIIAEVWNDPAIPLHWGKNVSGMQAKSELTGIKLKLAKFLWISASKIACIFAYLMYVVDLHKQISNRILEPFSHINVILTATEFDNFLELRNHPDAQPEIQELARQIKECLDSSEPQFLHFNEWHLPYVSDEELKKYPLFILLKASTARCARVSFNNHDGSSPIIEKDITLHDNLVGSEPRHSSPAEHQATPTGEEFNKNFRGWEQYRSYIENGIEL